MGDFLTDLPKMLLAAISILILGWISFISLHIFTLDSILHEHIASSNTILAQIANDVQWMKNEVQKEGRFTALDGTRHRDRIVKNEICCVEVKGKIIRLEVKGMQ